MPITDDPFTIIGGLIAHAESLQKDVGATISNFKEISEASSHLLLDAGATLKKLETVILTLPKLTEAASKDAISIAIKNGLSNASSVVRTAADVALKPSLDNLIKQSEQANTSAQAFDINSKKL